MSNETSNTQDSDINEVKDFSQEFSEVEVVKEDSKVKVSKSEINEINKELKEAINEDKNVFFEPDAAKDNAKALPPVEGNSDNIAIDNSISVCDIKSDFPYAIPSSAVNTCTSKGY